MTYQKLERELATQPEQPEQAGQGALTQSSKKELKSLEHIATTQKKVQGIKTDLDLILQALNQNPSLLTRAANFWNTIPLWQKIAAGAILTVPTLLLGIITTLAALISLSIVTAIVYTASSLLLDNHQNLTTEQTERLKVGISSLANLLDMVIATLEQLGTQLAVEVEQFKKENERLTVNINQLSKQVQSLKKEIVELNVSEKALRATQIQLEDTVKNLKITAETQTQTLEDTQTQLNQVVQAHTEHQAQLASKIKELEDLNLKLGQELEQVSLIAQVLRNSLESASNLIISDKEQRVAFHERLNELLADKQKSFYQILGDMQDAERKLTSLTTQLEESNLRYSDTLDKQEKYIKKLEQMVNELLQEEDSLKEGVKPSINGFYSIKKEPPVVAESTHEAVTILVV